MEKKRLNIQMKIQWNKVRWMRMKLVHFLMSCNKSIKTKNLRVTWKTRSKIGHPKSSSYYCGQSTKFAKHKIKTQGKWIKKIGNKYVHSFPEEMNRNANIDSYNRRRITLRRAVGSRKKMKHWSKLSENLVLNIGIK